VTQVHICKRHEYDEAQCRDVAEELLGMLVDRYGGRIRQDGSCYYYKHTTGISAVVETSDNDLDIKVKLGLMTRAWAPELEKEINRILDEHIS